MSSHGELIDNYLLDLTRTLKTLDQQSLTHLAKRLKSLIARRGHLYICGNGGSAANAMHLANDFTYGISPDGKALSVEALPANSAVISCLGNDIGYENIFAHQLKVKGKSDDILMVLSGSGNSANIVKSIEQAKANGMFTTGILGFDGGKAKDMLDLPIHFDINDMQVSEDTQLVVGHLLMKILYKELSND